MTVRYNVWDGSAESFTKYYNDILEDRGQLPAAMFALTGFDSERNNRFRLVPPPEPGFAAQEVEKSFDIDSVKGVLFRGDPWPFQQGLQIYTLPPPEETLIGASRYYLNIENEKV